MNIQNPKIAVLPSGYPMMFNCACIFSEEQTKLIKNEGTDISVIFNENRSITSISFSKFRQVHFQKKIEVEKGIPVLRRLNWNIIPTRFILGKNIWVQDSIKLVELYIKRYGKPDLIHVHFAFYAGIVAKYIKQKWGIPYIVTEHSTEFSYDISPSRTKEVFEIYDNAEVVVAVSNYLRDEIYKKINFDKERIKVIPNFIDTDLFRPDDIISRDKRENIIFTTCNLVERKRLDRLLDAFKIVSTRYPDWKLVIGGDGVEKHKLAFQVKELNLSDKVTLTGYLTQEQVRNYMAISSIFTLSSDFETFGVVLIEAMSMGLPVVATASGGPKDILTKETGILSEKTVDGLANGLIEVISNYNRYDKEYIRNYAVNNFGGRVIAKRYIEIYNQIVSKYKK